MIVMISENLSNNDTNHKILRFEMHVSSKSTSRLYTNDPSNQGYTCLDKSYNHMPIYICDKLQLHKNTYKCMPKHVML
jgi:hypothetical protein